MHKSTNTIEVNMGLFSKTSKTSKTPKCSQGNNTESAAQNTTEKPKPKSKFSKFFSSYKKLSSSADKTKIPRFASLDKQIAAMMPKHLGIISPDELTAIQNNPDIKNTLGLMGEGHTEQFGEQIKKLLQQSKPNASKKQIDKDMLLLAQACGYKGSLKDIKNNTNHYGFIQNVLKALNTPKELDTGIDLNKHLQALLLKQSNPAFANLLRAISGSNDELLTNTQAVALFDRHNNLDDLLSHIILSSVTVGIAVGAGTADPIHDAIIDDRLGGYLVSNHGDELASIETGVVLDKDTGKLYIDAKNGGYYELDSKGNPTSNRPISVNIGDNTQAVNIDTKTGNLYERQILNTDKTNLKEAGYYQINPSTGERIEGGDFKPFYVEANQENAGRFNNITTRDHSEYLVRSNGDITNTADIAQSADNDIFGATIGAGLAGFLAPIGLGSLAIAAHSLAAKKALSGDRNISPSNWYNTTEQS
jgi:hypothetical protein